jgi:hypothetical protein
MNIEQTKKMNLMIKELTKSGMVNSFDDAVTQATGLYQNSMPTHMQSSQVLVKPEPVKKQDSAQVSEISEEKVVESNSGFDTQQVNKVVEEKINSIMQKNNTQIANEMKKIWDYIKDMKEGYESKIIELKRELNANRQANQSNNNSNDQNSKPDWNNANANTKQTQLNTQKKENVNPRQGEFTPDNVVLENYFYYGNK